MKGKLAGAAYQYSQSQRLKAWLRLECSLRASKILCVVMQEATRIGARQAGRQAVYRSCRCLRWHMTAVAHKHLIFGCICAQSDLEVVATKHNTHDVLADIVNIALDCGHDDDSSIILRGVATFQLLLFYVG